MTSPDSPASAPTPPKPNKALNAIVLVVAAIGLAFSGWWMFLRPTPVVTVRESHQTSGSMIVEGTVPPPLNEATLALRALERGDTVMSMFQLRDDTGLLDVYFDPARLSMPSEGQRLRVTGHRAEATGADWHGVRPFVANELERLE